MCRRIAQSSNMSNRCSAAIPGTPKNITDSSSQVRLYRFYIVWTARILLPLVYVLSIAQLVVPPSTDKAHQLQSIGQTSAILVITHSRDVYLARCLHSLFSHHPGGSEWPIIVSKDEQDGEHPAIGGVLAHFVRTAQARNITFVVRAHAVTYNALLPNNSCFIDSAAYGRISRHYKWALTQAFYGNPVASSSDLPFLSQRLERVVIVEDDMEVAADFYDYFTALAPMLDQDESLYCVSAWNDNGISTLALNSSQLHRTDFFPGLGWMLTRSLWLELAPKWPAIFWDDWMRSVTQTRGRQCIRPEVSRTANFGRVGVSQSFHFAKHVSKVILSAQYVDFSKLDLSYLQPDLYHHTFFSQVSNATRLKFSNYLTSRPVKTDVIAFYPPGRLESISKRTGIMADHRNGICRTSYHGVITFPWRDHNAFVVEKGWTPPEGYQLGLQECC